MNTLKIKDKIFKHYDSFPKNTLNGMNVENILSMKELSFFKNILHCELDSKLFLSVFSRSIFPSQLPEQLIANKTSFSLFVLDIEQDQSIQLFIKNLDNNEIQSKNLKFKDWISFSVDSEISLLINAESLLLFCFH